MSQAQSVEANTVGIPATEGHQDQRLHLLEEQRVFCKPLAEIRKLKDPVGQRCFSVSEGLVSSRYA